MSRKKNKQEEIFNDFLKAAREGAAEDDFEREAREGFALLGTGEERIQAKSGLDEKMKEVFAAKKRSRKSLWYAAAGILLVAGFAVYFIDGTRKQKDLALAPAPALREMRMPEPAQLTWEKSENVPEKNEPEAHQFKHSADKEPGNQGKSSSKGEAPAPQENKTASEKQKLQLEEKAVMGNAAEADIATAQSERLSEPNSVAAAPAAMPPSPSAGAVISLQKSAEYPVDREDQAFMRSKKEEAGNSCYYAGGEKALRKVVALKLQEKDLMFKFNARLFINNLGKVENAEITEGSDLTEDQKTAVVGQLKMLDQFVFYNAQGEGILAEYVLVFRP